MFKTRHSLPGAAPATLTPHTVNGQNQKPIITVVEYDEHDLKERQLDSIRNLPAQFTVWTEAALESWPGKFRGYLRAGQPQPRISPACEPPASV